jgi:hypothetical protein
MDGTVWTATGGTGLHQEAVGDALALGQCVRSLERKPQRIVGGTGDGPKGVDSKNGIDGQHLAHERLRVSAVSLAELRRLHGLRVADLRALSAVTELDQPRLDVLGVGQVEGLVACEHNDVLP